jgi:hypothetical protein
MDSRHSGWKKREQIASAERGVISRRVGLAAAQQWQDSAARPGEEPDRLSGRSAKASATALKKARPKGKNQGLLRCFLALGYVFSLGAFLPLDDFKLNVIAFLQALVAFRLDGAVVDEHVRAVIPSDETEALRVIEPFHFTFNSRHVSYSERPWSTQTRPGDSVF